MMEFSQAKEATQFVKAIPADKLASKTRSTAVGSGSIVTAFVLLIWFTPPIPTWAFAVLLAFGAYSISGDLVRGFAAFLAGAIQDVRAAVKGTSNG